MTNPNSVDFQAWEEEMQPYGADILVDAIYEAPERVLACSSVADFAIMDIAPEDVDALSLA